ncbi:uncharacterized protein LOC118262291 [Spodoptera frugiperda]|uniref:Uncharacterized protein LOC118262291 n=1 Tax=Spodoptera frugiperda TaxID=7108 RepID=A0A9R0DUQ7_SPOFR|nr:uncharacterized protein LOC118262291 [Spodoptera frugiperda]
MERFGSCVLLISVLLVLNIEKSYQHAWVTTDELENHINPEDLLEFANFNQHNDTTKIGDIGDDAVGFADAVETTTGLPVPGTVDCFGLGTLSRQIVSLFNMRPDSSDEVNTHFYFSSRTMPTRMQVFPGSQFGLEWVDFKPNRKTVMIIHGFMSHSNASWVNDMTKAFLEWADVNVIAVDWSGGGNTWKYWRAVANTRRVGSDIVGFMRRMMTETGVRTKDMHLVGHSLGAHIASYVSYHLGKVARITGLDPAQPCFWTTDSTERLDPQDADFVDIIHTNGRLLSRIGFGFPDPNGHADFYPNGGMKQPGCYNETTSIWSRLIPFSSRLQQAICSHGRAYLLFTESLINRNCTFRGHRWDLTYEGVNASLKAACDRVGSCSEMGIRAVGEGRLPRATGAYFVLTTDKDPYCPDLLSPLDYDFRWYLTDTLFGRGQCSHATCISCGSSVACDVPWRTIIERVHKSCQEMVSECRYNDVEFPCCEYFREVDSEHGPCFSFNTLQHKGENSLFDLNRTTGPGVLMFRLLSDAEISIHSPEELSTQFLDGKLKEIVHTFIENHVSFLFSVVEIVNGEQLKTEPIEVRQCRYLHEVPDDLLHTYPVYSYGACRLAETTKEFYQQCGCVHPVRDPTYKELYCNYSGITCWNVYEGLKEKLGADKITKDNCLPSCVESELKTIHYSKRWEKDENSVGTLVEVRMASLPTLRYQRNLLRDKLDLVVAVGGIGGLFFSASVLSLLEVFYLILRPMY